MNCVFWAVMKCGTCKTDVSEELSASIIRVTRIGEIGKPLAVKFLRNVGSYKRYTA
jgi:hypothetical protein